MEKNKKKVILIVEDEGFLSNIYSLVLKNNGFETIVAENGEEGLKEVIKHPDAILLDILFPGKMNGLDVLKEIKKNPKTSDIPVVIMSNLSDDKVVKEGLSLGANAYLVKSRSNPDDMVDNVKKLIK